MRPADPDAVEFRDHGILSSAAMAIPFEPIDPADERYTFGLLERLRAGDSAAGETLFRLHFERLRRAIRPYFRGQHRALLDEDELLQRALVRAFRSLGTFRWRGKGAFLAWVKGIALNELRREVQSRSRTEPIDAATAWEDSGSRQDRLPSREPSPSQSLLNREEAAIFEEALHELPEDERDLIVHRQILEQDYESLATDLGISEGAVRTKVSRAMSRLAKLVESRS